jgi:predicted DCC family thiol-disulfide oxidoreductase YuxK
MVRAIGHAACDIFMTSDHPIILFDAICVLCSANARFVLTHDKRAHFRLASVQGDTGAALCRAHGIDPDNPSTIIVVEGAHVRRDSDAVLTIYEALGWPWRAARLLRIVPAGLRDPIYRWVARHRYRIFGKRATCWVAPPEFRERIL